MAYVKIAMSAVAHDYALIPDASYPAFSGSFGVNERFDAIGLFVWGHGPLGRDQRLVPDGFLWQLPLSVVGPFQERPFRDFVSSS